MPKIQREISTTPLELYQDRIDEFIKAGKSNILTGHRITSTPMKYAFYLKKPFLPIGLPFQYKTALIATFKRQDDETIIEITNQTPPFIAIAIALTIFGFLFDSFILKSSFSFESKIFFLLIVASVLVYHSITKGKIESSFRQEIFNPT